MKQQLILDCVDSSVQVQHFIFIHFIIIFLNEAEDPTSFGIYNFHSLYKQGSVAFGVLDKHQQQFQRRLHHQTKLDRETKS